MPSPEEKDDHPVERIHRRISELEEEVDRLSRSVEGLQKIEANYLTILESADDAVFIKDTDGRYVIVNSVLASRLGLAKEEIIGKTPLEVYPPDIGAKVREDDLDTMSSGSVRENEDRMWTSEGERVFLARKVPVRDRNEEIVGLIGISRDITERNRLEEVVEARAAELARSNAELEQFAYVASHDLQEPLRMVSSFSELIARRYADRLDAEGKEFVSFVSDGANRMRRLIEDLLEYSRVGTGARRAELSDSRAALADALANLKAAADDAQATVTYDELPEVPCEGGLLARLFQNLVGNALKFRGDNLPRVHISAARADGEWRFSVRDNGIGIDPRYGDRVFDIFRRLHSREEYEGTGVGLAICKKIVEQHGGRIWVESEPGVGSTFRFTLPAYSPLSEGPK